MPPSILSPLYYGEICPSASLECDREAYQKTTKELITVLEKIEEVIPPGKLYPTRRTPGML